MFQKMMSLIFFLQKFKKLFITKKKLIQEEQNKEKNNVDGLIYSKCIENKQ